MRHNSQSVGDCLHNGRQGGNRAKQLVPIEDPPRAVGDFGPCVDSMVFFATLAETFHLLVFLAGASRQCSRGLA